VNRGHHAKGSSHAKPASALSTLPSITHVNLPGAKPLTGAVVATKRFTLGLFVAWMLAFAIVVGILTPRW
jgi:hypothetical protein